MDSDPSVQYALIGNALNYILWHYWIFVAGEWPHGHCERAQRIKSEIEENRKKLDSSSNKRTNKIVVRRVTSSSTESKSKKIILARKSDSDYNVEEVQKGMKFQESGEIVG